MLGPVTTEEWTWWFCLLFSYSSCLWRLKDLTFFCLKLIISYVFFAVKNANLNVDMQDCTDDIPHLHYQHYWVVSHSGIVSWPKQSRCTKNLLIMPIYFFPYILIAFPLFQNFKYEIIGGVSTIASLKTPWLLFKR